MGRYGSGGTRCLRGLTVLAEAAKAPEVRRTPRRFAQVEDARRAAGFGVRQPSAASDLPNTVRSTLPARTAVSETAQPKPRLAWITGAGGLIGSHLLAAAPLHAPSWHVLGLTRPQLDLSDFAAFETSLMSVDADGGGDEPQWDAVYELGTGELALSWREGATRIIAVFTDEEGQSYRTRRGLSAVDEAAMCAAQSRGEVLAVVAEPRDHPDFDDCAAVFPISDDAVAMAALLDSIIADPCGP